MNRLTLLLSFCMKVPHPFLSMAASCDSELVAEDDGNTVELELATSSKPPNTKSEPHQNANIPGIMVIWWKEKNEKAGQSVANFTYLCMALSNRNYDVSAHLVHGGQCFIRNPGVICENCFDEAQEQPYHDDGANSRTGGLVVDTNVVESKHCT